MVLDKGVRSWQNVGCLEEGTICSVQVLLQYGIFYQRHQKCLIKNE